MISGFTFVHNALDGGYPLICAIEAVYPQVDELLIVEAESTDGTREMLEKYKDSHPKIRIIDGKWEYSAEGCLTKLHAMHTECKGDVILAFEADEVFDDNLILNVKRMIQFGHRQILVWRIQVEQNFQRVRWYPHQVHRVFLKGTVTKDGESTVEHKKKLMEFQELPAEAGYIYDVTNCFRDNWKMRYINNARLHDGGAVTYRKVPEHFIYPWTLEEKDIDKFLAEPQWTFKTSPFKLPERLERLVGMTKYKPRME